MARKKTSKAAGGNFAEPEIEYIEQLLKFMTDHNLEEFEYSRGDLRIRLRKPSSGTVVHTGRAMHPPEIIVAGGAEGAHGASGGAAPAAANANEDLHLIKSPIVGTFYGAPSPGAENFVKVGSHVEAGQTLCIVEAMKLMNEIESDASGEITRVYVENGQPVEYGQPLFGIRAARKK
jgi:acetyl-CoA carboxylase biotin carboxyl carrier protein